MHLDFILSGNFSDENRKLKSAGKNFLYYKHKLKKTKIKYWKKFDFKKTLAYNIKNKILTASQGKMNTKKQLNIKKASKKAVKPQININIFSLKISVAKDEKCNPECYFSLD